MPEDPSIPPGPPIDVLRTDESGEVDLEQLEYNLSLTPQERIEQNDRWAEFVRVLRDGGRKFYAEAD